MSENFKETVEGMCPRCGEYTEVAWDDDGCCGAGAEREGRIYRFDDFEEPEPEFDAEAHANNQALDVWKETKYGKE